MSETNGELIEARGCASRLRKAQTTLKLSNGQFVARFRDANGDLLLGSQRTWERISKDQWDDNKPEKWLPRLRQACAQLDGGTPVRTVFNEMPFFKEATKELMRLEAQTTDRRVLVVLAPTGTGKSVWARAQADKQRGSRLYVRAMPGWKENGIAICTGMIEGINGEKLRYIGYDEALSKLRVILAASPKTVFIDEAHEGGIELMKLIRYLVDETPSRFVYIGYPTEYDRVVGANTGALAEARQFLGRSLKPIFSDYRKGTKPEDVAVVLKQAGIDDAKVLANQITPTLIVREGLRTLADCLELAQEWAADEEKPVNGELLTQALDEIAGTTEKERRKLLEEQLKSN